MMNSRWLAIWIVRGMVLVAVLVGGMVPAQAQGPDATVRPDTLNMRFGPGSEYAVIASLTRGTALTLLAQDDIPGNGIWVWSQTAEGTQGWVSSDYLDIRPDLNLDALPVRPAPDSLGTPIEPTTPILLPSRKTHRQPAARSPKDRDFRR